MLVRDFDEWRGAARRLLAAGTPPEDVTWEDEHSLALAFDDPLPLPASTRAPAVSLSRDLLERLEACACHRDPGRWALMYRILWRVAQGERDLARISADVDIRALDERVKAVRRDCHKMTAFVRFREVKAGEAGDEARFVAWFEPSHRILRRTSRFFVDRFASMHWTIVTPDGAMTWDRRSVTFLDDASSIVLPDRDAAEDLWRAYYRSIFNPARLNLATMRREMPVHYWRNLPEAREVPHLAAEAQRRASRFIETTPSAKRTSAERPQRVVPIDARPATLDALRAAVSACTRCPLHHAATQAVPAVGPATGARVMLVGEQPGDEEDLRGEPFVGPAGRLLDVLLREAGLDRASLHLTNAVKHFKWTPRGKRRIHKTPAQAEVAACMDWLEAEIEMTKPHVIVALGGTALRALTGWRGGVGEARGVALTHRLGARVIATYHPSAILRAEPEEAEAIRRALVEALVTARSDETHAVSLTDASSNFR